MIPFFGGIAGMIGLLLLPIRSAISFWWIPAIADLGCAPLLLAVIANKLRKKITASP